MGSGPSREELKADSDFMSQVRENQSKILKGCEDSIATFFASVDDMVVSQGAIAEKKVEELEKKSTEELKKVENAAKAAGDQASATAATATSKPDEFPTAKSIVHKPKSSVLVLLNSANVFYSESSHTDPAVLKALVDQIQKSIGDLTGGLLDAGKPNPETGAQAPTENALVAGIKTLFVQPAAVKAAVEGVSSIVNILLSSMESNLTVSSSLQKKIQFVAPGMYCATYFSTSVFKFVSGGFNKKTLTYSLNCGGIYLVTSAKLVQVVSSLAMYKEIADSFTKRLRSSEQTLTEFVGALSDAAYFGHKFGFTDTEYQKLTATLKTDVMKGIVSDFWEATKDEDKKTRTDTWNDYVKDGDFNTRIESIRSAYEAAYNDLKKYYTDYVLNPPITQN